MAFDLAVCYWNYFREASVERLGLIVLVLDRPRSSESPLLEKLFGFAFATQKCRFINKSRLNNKT